MATAMTDKRKRGEEGERQMAEEEGGEGRGWGELA